MSQLSPTSEDQELIENLRMDAETDRWRSGGIPIEETDSWKAAERIQELLNETAILRGMLAALSITTTPDRNDM